MTVPGRKTSAPKFLPRWHKPKIVDLGIHVPPKKNTWRNFFNIVGKHFASHQTFPKVYPKVRIFSEHKAKLNRVRVARHKKNQHHRHLVKKRLDPIRFYNIPLPDSVVNQIVLELKIQKSEGSMSERERHEILALVIAEVVKSAMKNNR